MTSLWKDVTFQKRLLWLNGALPAVFLLSDLMTGRLGANPPEAILRTTGVVAIIFLVLTLMVTPLMRQRPLLWLARHRRWLGLWSFYYAALHLAAYAVFDKELVAAEIARDIVKRPFILLGFAAFLLLIPLAITSTDRMVLRLGPKRWKRLHRATYLIAILATLHYDLIVKSDIFYPVLFALAFLLLFALRFARTPRPASRA